MQRFRSRRDFLFQSGGGISGLGLLSLLDQDGLLAPAIAVLSAGRQTRAKKPHFQPRAKSVISLFMSGGVSHVDTFDPKPALNKYAGQPLTGKGEVVVRQGHPGPLMPSPFQFRKYGEAASSIGDLSRASHRTSMNSPSCDRSSASRTITCRRTTSSRPA